MARKAGRVRIGAKSDYAVRATVVLARADGDFVKADTLAAAAAVPLEFLENILRDLRRAGVVAAQRGADGGYRLAVPPDEVTIATVIRAVRGPLADGDDAARPADDAVGRLWRDVNDVTRRALEAVTLAALATDDAG
jgi:Rrf2 family protein